MKITLETIHTVVTIDNQSKGDTDETDTIEALEMWMSAMVGLTYHPDSINRAICEQAEMIDEIQM